MESRYARQPRRHCPLPQRLCHSAADVQLAVKAAVSFKLPLSVRGGGYDSVGRGLCAGLVVGLQTMRHIAVDTRTETVTLDGGCTLRDVSMAVAAHSYAVVTGACSEVGLTGWTLGGGYGQLNGRYGMGVDNVVSAQVVLADGSLVTAKANSDDELLWCLQGGGGGFGVVVSLTIRMYPLSEILTGIVIFPLDEAAAVLRGYMRLIYQQPDAFGCVMLFMHSPIDGTPVLALAPCWTGDMEEGKRVVHSSSSWARLS